MQITDKVATDIVLNRRNKIKRTERVICDEGISINHFIHWIMDEARNFSKLNNVEPNGVLVENVDDNGLDLVCYATMNEEEKEAESKLEQIYIDNEIIKESNLYGYSTKNMESNWLEK